MADMNMCNRFDFISGGRVVYKGTQFTEYEEVEQPKPEEPEEKKFDGSSLTGKVLGAVAAAGCVAAAFGLVAAWGVSAFFSGGATAAAAPLVWQAAAFCLAAAPIAWGAAEAIGNQYDQDMANQQDSGWGTYAKLSILDPIVVGAQDIVIGAVVGSALAGAGRLGSKLMGKMFVKSATRARVGVKVSPMEKTYDMALDPEYYARSVAEKYRINLKGSGQKITIKFNPDLSGAGKSRRATPDIIEVGPSAYVSEEELANTIAHELNHARSWLKGGNAPESSAYGAGDTLADYIRGGR